ncbi:Retrovirus-related Pol polyprotein from transposon TNT 1-94 [Vitis vinifera]|uniref:Retrovirus-related Pol polyprotein from transposon TNT 1-94 n=1 Tax=Vitis vinifera TaxID=29760 RepID=A0A438FUK5_VITVI|nr:Retrovirus-related Pol polyprotein from transposon TNT 1-94 [Vitis vinifera]
MAIMIIGLCLWKIFFVQRSIGAWSRMESLPAEGIEPTEAQQKAIADHKLKDLKVKNYLFQAIDRNIMETILNKESKHIWDSMKQKYQGSTRVKRAQLQALRREFEVLQMKEGESVDEYFARTLTIANKMKIHGESMKQVVIIEKILRSMTSRFDYVVCSVEESNDLDTLTIDELQSSLLVHEQRMNGHGRDEQALKGTFNMSVLNGKGAHYAELDEKEEMLLMSYVELNQSRKEDVWFLDSGCSNHMCGNKLWFSDLDEEFRQSVKLGNNSKMTVLGKGNIRMQVAGVTQVITDVFYIPELRNNLLSVGQLQEKGVAILIQHGECRVYHPEKGLIMQTSMSANRMFILPARVMPKAPTCFQITLEDNTHLWHCRYGHLSFKGLRTLQYKEMVRGLPQLKASSKVCTDCMVGKQHRDAIPKRSLWRASQRLQLVHADICGPIKPVSNSKKRYLIIDDYSRKVWIYFLTEKSEAFTTFKNYKNLVEKETGAFICCLRTDRGGEFTSLEFNAFCKTNGISRQLTAAYTPQQNGVAERKNRTIMNMKSYIGSKRRDPEEAWSGVKPNVDYFRVFGCIGHVHVPDNKRKKLDDKSFQCVLLGVSEESKAYRLYDPVSKKIVVSRDVVFEEDKCWNWGRSNEEVRLDVLEWGDSNEEGSEDEQGEDDAEEGVAVEGREREDSLSSSESLGSLSESLGENSGVSGESSPSSQQGRNRRVPFWMEDYFQVESCNGLGNRSNRKEWTWELTDLPEGVKKIGVKWVFKTKLNENGKVDKCKARLVAKGYAQQHGIDYTEVFAPVARWDTIRMVIALAARNGWSVYQLDVKSAFLHGELNEAVFIEQPQGYEKKGEEHKVYKLKKALYGLKQAPRACQRKYAKEVLERFGMEKSNSVKNPIVPGDRLTKNEGGVKVDATKFMASPTEMHLQAAKRVLRYLKGTVDLGVFYQKEGNGELMAYTDSDYAGDVDDRKSTSGYVFLLSEGAVAWSSKKQPVVTLSTTEAEFVAAASCACQGVWMRRVLEKLGHSQGKCTTVLCDNILL